MKHLFLITISAVIFVAISALEIEHDQFIDRAKDIESRKLVSLNGPESVQFVTHILEFKLTWYCSDNF